MSGGQGAPTPSGRRMSVQEAMKLAATHHGAGRLRRAEIVLRQLLQQRPDHTDALHMLAVIAHQAGQTKIGIGLIESAVAINPNVAVYQANLAEMYRRVGDAAKAIAHGERAIALDPRNADAHNNLGIAYYDQGDFESAV